MRCRYMGYRRATAVKVEPRWMVEAMRARLLLEGLLAEVRWLPDADVIETDSDIVVLVDIAGAREADFDVALFEDALVIHGHRRLPCEAGGVYHTAAIRHGPFRLEVPLPVPVDPERVAAHYDVGIL